MLQLRITRSASRLMMLGTLLNLALDPIMIFGGLGFPAMGIAGAALATLLSHLVATVWLVYLLGKKHHLLAWPTGVLRDYAVAAKRIAHFALPNIASMILMPVSATIITRIISQFGNEAVAACGAAARIEMFAFVIPMALGISLTPFVSQNYGANRLDRIQQAQSVATWFALAYGALVGIVFFLAAPRLAALFSTDPRVVKVLVAYIRIISFGYGMMEVHRYCGFFLTGLHRPISATALNVVRVVVLLIPLSVAGAKLAGIPGVFTGRLIADLVSGAVAIAWVAHASRLRQPHPVSLKGALE